ncbi:hypothetical protein NUW54_g10015 [Trametes sanguinea]|uniref:Uncharacterized protein n=1 Tax=Trametes sanguinea TaxID=158606 RepID=A0ACC1P239_9APHY|nr:hypothetical protein NUW54_g10015 [Trametes sanguinea]
MKLSTLLSFTALVLAQGTLGRSTASADRYTNDTRMDTISSMFARSIAEDGLAPRHNLSGPTKASSYILPRAGLGKLEKRQPPDTRPTPEPTGAASTSTTVHIIDEHDFALLLPDRPGGKCRSPGFDPGPGYMRLTTRFDAFSACRTHLGCGSDGVSYCTPVSTDPACSKRVQDGFIRAAAVTTSDDGSYIQNMLSEVE